MQRNLDMNEPITGARPDSLGGDPDASFRRVKPSDRAQSGSQKSDDRRQSPRSDRSDRNAADFRIDDRPVNDSRKRKTESETAPKRNKAKHIPADQVNGQLQDVYIGNLPWKLTDDDLLHMAAKYGTVTGAKVKMDRRGRSKGVGFVTMPKSDASRAVHSLDGKKVNGRPLKVRFATPEPRQATR